MSPRWYPRPIRRGDPIRAEWAEELQAQVVGRVRDERVGVEELFIRLTSTGSSQYEWKEVLHQPDGTWYETGRVGTLANTDRAQEANNKPDAINGDVYYAWRSPSSNKLLFFADAGDMGASSSAIGRCSCPEDPYEIQVKCGPCYVLPRIYEFTVTGVSANGSSSSASCANIFGTFRLYNETNAYGAASCSWSGFNGQCQQAELVLSSTVATITIINESGHVLAIVRVNVASFVCCGRTTGWVNDSGNDCTITAVLAPDPCTCCPSCPPVRNMRLCDATDCCVKACGLTVQVQNLYTPAPVPCTLFDDPCYTAAGASCPFPVGNPGRLGCFKSIATPPESCGGMNGVYGVTWVRNCTWLYYGIPAGTGSTQTRGLLTLSGRVWTLRLEGENGQIAVFRSSSWTCGTFPIALAFVAGESTCKSSSPVPSATILSKP